jgi:hypothetical protein
MAGSKGRASQSSSGMRPVTFSAREERLDCPALWLCKKSMPVVLLILASTDDDVARDGNRGGLDETTKLSRRRAT